MIIDPTINIILIASHFQKSLSLRIQFLLTLTKNYWFILSDTFVVAPSVNKIIIELLIKFKGFVNGILFENYQMIGCGYLRINQKDRNPKC